MKNSIIILASILTLAIIISVGMNFSITTKTTNLSMKNIEALADGESSLTGYQNAKRIYCVVPAGKTGCISQFGRHCSEDIFCTH